MWQRHEQAGPHGLEPLNDDDYTAADVVHLFLNLYSFGLNVYCFQTIQSTVDADIFKK